MTTPPSATRSLLPSPRYTSLRASSLLPGAAAHHHGLPPSAPGWFPLSAGALPGTTPTEPGWLFHCHSPTTLPALPTTTPTKATTEASHRADEASQKTRASHRHIPNLLSLKIYIGM
uniref:Uncharacterized protein n=1 Tax=Oryza glumipatula TaxID=40148 RepID=A0A0D9YZF4_9ORYZ